MKSDKVLSPLVTQLHCLFGLDLARNTKGVYFLLLN